MQGDPGLAFFLGEPLDSPGGARAASKGGQKKPASAGATDLLGLTMDEELTEEEELVSQYSVSSHNLLHPCHHKAVIVADTAGAGLCSFLYSPVSTSLRAGVL